MERRAFLRNLLGAAAVVSTNPVSFFAPVGGWSSDVLINPNAPPSCIDFLNSQMLEKVLKTIPPLWALESEALRQLQFSKYVSSRAMRVPFTVIGA